MIGGRKDWGRDPTESEGKRRSKPARGHPVSGAPRRPRLSPHSLPALGTSQAPGSPGTSGTGTGLRGEACSGGSGEAPLPMKVFPPREIGIGAPRAPPSSLEDGNSAPRARRGPAGRCPRTRTLTFSWKMDSMFICLEPTAPATDHPLLLRPRPGPTPPPTRLRPTRPAPGHVSRADQSHPRMRVTWREEQVKARVVNAGTRDLCNASSYPLLAGRWGGGLEGGCCSAAYRLEDLLHFPPIAMDS